MKMRLLLFLGLLVGSVSLSLLTSPATYATGEAYKWINATTIEGSGGAYNSTSGVVRTGNAGPSRPEPVKTVSFIRDGTTKTFRASTDNIYYGNAGGGGGLSISSKCDLQLSITVTALNGGTISTNDPGKKKCTRTGLTEALTIADTEKGPTAESLGVPAAVTTGPGAAPPTDEPVSTCMVDGIGWIICPVVRTMASMVDGAYAFVSSLLEVQPIVSNANDGPSKSIYDAWSIMRNFANIAFVIAFMIIIFSQLTSVGLNNYGIKKMLPRLIVAAILVNTSFWICAVAVDISNILGASLNGLLKGLPVNEAVNSTEFTFDDMQTGNGWLGITGGVLAATAISIGVLYATLSALLPALLAALIAIATVFVVLTIRQALIILLIVISPLAFVAYLLPNTESLFKKWLGLFKTLLLMYPIIAVIFGASALASQIIMTSASGDYKVAVQIMGALVAIIPLALTPVVMKTAGGLLNRFGAVVNNPNKGPFDRMKKGAQGYHENRQAYRKLKAFNGERTLPGVGKMTRMRANREAVLNNRKSELNRASTSYIADKAETNDNFRAQLAQGGGDGADMRALAGAINVKAELETKEVKAASAVIEHMNLSSSQLNSLAQGGDATSGDENTPPEDRRTLRGADDAVRKAAIMSAVSTGTVGDVEGIIKSAGTMTSSQHKTLASAVASSGIANRATHLGGQTIDDIAQGNIQTDADLDRVTARAINNGKYSAEKIADNDKDSLKRVADVLQQVRTDVAAEQRAGISEQATKAATDGRISGRITDAQKPQLERLRH